MKVPPSLRFWSKAKKLWADSREAKRRRQAATLELDKSTLLESNAMLAEEFGAVHGVDLPASGAITLETIQQAHFEQQAAALCLSGGGIRSAAFGLGAVQGLARRGILKRFHYLSSVSGGGYTGSFASAWIYRAREGIKDVERGLNQRKAPENEDEAKCDPVRWLRRYTSYLSPRYGLLSPDTWTLGAIYIRNLLLNWFVLLPALGALLCVPLFVASLLLSDWLPVPVWAGYLLLMVGLFALRARLCFFPGHNEIAGIPLHQALVGLLVVGAALLSAGHYAAGDRSAINWFSADTVPFVFGIGAVVSIGIFLASVITDRAEFQREGLALGLILTTLLGGILLAAWLTIFPDFLPDKWDEHSVRQRLFLILAPPALLAFMMLPEAVFVGIAARHGEDHDREWWARVVAVLLGVAVIWLIVGVVVLLGSIALREFWQWASSSVTFASVLAALLAVGGFVARRGFLRGFAQQDADVPTGPSLANRAGHLVLNVMAAVLIAVLLASIAAGLEVLFELVSTSRAGIAPPVGEMRYTPFDVFLAFLFLCMTTLWFGAYVDINRFSLHGMYRDRLSRAFLAASRWERTVPGAYNVQRDAPEGLQFRERMEDRFTNFDRYDSPLLQWLDPSRRGGVTLSGAQLTPQEVKDEGPMNVADHVRAPLHVINCALNMVGDKTNTALQERKAASFTFTPLHAGNHDTKYRRTGIYGGPDGVSLATAMTISGAAVSPNAGQYSTRIMTFIMTLFNARLGWWLGNPSNLSTCIQVAPGISTGFLLRELFGLTRGAGNWLFLSDGGHFDNLGLYEMVRRGCRYIVAVDASADPDRTFEDFGNAIRKVRVDFGVEITRREPFQIDARLRGMEGRYAALFDIVYPHLQGTKKTGTLVYIKPSIYRSTPQGAPIDVVEYGSRSAAFPHEPTSEQFYLESQFESYRALGEHEMEEILRGFAWSLPEMHESVRAHIKEPFQWPLETARM